MASEIDLPYFELGWAILSSIGLVNVLCGLMVRGIIGPSQVILVPIVVSAAGAIANGLCYAAFYTTYPLYGRLAAGVIADIGWLVEEAGLSFYSYLIVKPLLRDRTRIYFHVSYWSLMASVLAFKIAILVLRVQVLINPTELMLRHISYLHIGYFVSIALAETLTACLLLQYFRSATLNAKSGAIGDSLFRYLMRSTEIRAATVCLIGITRATTYSFQSTAQLATTTAGQVDRFVATLEMMFPVVMYIDILASRLESARHWRKNNSGSVSLHVVKSKQHPTVTVDIKTISLPKPPHWTEHEASCSSPFNNSHGDASSSKENILILTDGESSKPAV